MISDDCDDTDATMYPLAAELCDGQDNDCANGIPSNEIDDDGDNRVECSIDGGGWDGAVGIVSGVDCNDNEATIYTGATELCDGQDNDCDSSVPSDEIDDDSDGHMGGSIDGGGWDGSITSGFGTMLGADCVDTDATIYPLAVELCDGQDNDCANGIPGDEIDNDSDGHVECSIDGGGWDGSITNGFTSMISDDCDDTDANDLSAAAELCDGQDNDCDNGIPSNEIDHDSDNHVECSIDGGGWDGVAGIVSGVDCNESDATIYTGATELCDGLDNDCDSSVPSDEIDDDGDNRVECSIDGGGWDGSAGIVSGVDCNDGDATIYTGATELCDGLDKIAIVPFPAMKLMMMETIA